MMIISLLLLCILILSLCHYVIHYGKFGRNINRIPGNPTLPLIGNTLEWCTGSSEEFWKFQRRLSKTFYPIFKAWHANIASVTIQHADDLETILGNTKEHLRKGYIYNYLKPWLGTGLLTSEGTKWYRRRKMLTSAFHFNVLKQFVDVLIEEGNYMVQCIKDNEKLIITDLFSLVSHHTLNAICETAMGTSLKDMDEFQQRYREAIRDISKILEYRIRRPWLHSDMIFALTPASREQAKCLKIVHDFTDKIIAQRKKYHKSTNGWYLKQFENNSIADDKVLGIQKKRLAMLDLLIAASYNSEINDLHIREEVDTFMFEGHDTTSTGICFAILLLAEHKDIQSTQIAQDIRKEFICMSPMLSPFSSTYRIHFIKYIIYNIELKIGDIQMDSFRIPCAIWDRVRNEVDAVIQENGGRLIMSALNNMPYLERCLKESLRLYPSVPFITRLLSKDTKLQSYVVPSGTIIRIPIYDIHRDPNFWPNPEVFDPDRFLPERIKNRHPFSYIPFSGGPRNCIGQRFAMLELKAIIASLVHNFYFEPIDSLKDFRFIVDMVIRTTHPIRVKFVPIVRTESSEVKQSGLIKSDPFLL